VIGDARTLPQDAELETVVCIVGGGAAGIVLARELAAGRVPCVLLEAGGLGYDPRDQALYRGENVGLPYFPLDVARLRYLGGSTNHYGGVTRPFDPEDFEVRPGVPHTGWPITRADLEPYYRRAWEILGLPAGEHGLDAAFEDDPFEPLDVPADRLVTRVAAIVPKDHRSLGAAYEDELRRSTDITVLLHANVTEIETDGEARRVTRVRVATLEGGRFGVRAKVFVLAAGGLENPRLLLASRGTRPAGLGNDYGLVGRYFLEHPRFDAAIVLPSAPDLDVGFYDLHDAHGLKREGYLALPPALEREEGLVDVQLKLRAVPVKAYADAERSAAYESLKSIARHAADAELPDRFGAELANVLDDVMSWQSFSLPGVLAPVPFPEVVGRLMRAAPAEKQALIPEVLGDVAGMAYKAVAGRVPLDAVVVTARIDPQPNPNSRVTLADERDELGMPRLRLDWQLTELDRESVGRALDLLASAFGARGLGRVRRLFDPRGSDWPGDLAGGWHHMGTTRMSTDPSRGVVDPDCRVFGTSNLYVAGSSVFPTAGSGTPTYTLVALALRLGAHLRETAL
jgi:choline dehydrogenase-like flavoprotein